MRRSWDMLVRLSGSLGLAVCLLVTLGVLTFLGTLEQTRSGLYEVQHKYFESFVLLHDFGPFSLPLPGANLVLSLLALNLVVGGVLRLKKSARTSGILIAHLGILLMLVAGFVKWRFSNDGQITLFEGQRADYFNDPYRCELSIVEHRPSGEQFEYRVPEEMLEAPRGANSVRLIGPDLPFSLEVVHFARNTRVLPKGPMFEVKVPVIDGYFLSEEPLNKEAETNIAGAYLHLVDARSAEVQEAIVWSAEAEPWTAKVGTRTFSFDLRRERHDLPFEIGLDHFAKVDHPGTSTPQSFTSDVIVNESGSERALHISMNEPLRSQGMVVYQASWGPQDAGPGARLFSTFAVVRNPADRLPLYACIVIATGLLLHFGRKLRSALRAKALVQ
jgi:cytochrome c biogenesis protein ResB